MQREYLHSLTLFHASRPQRPLAPEVLEFTRFEQPPCPTRPCAKRASNVDGACEAPAAPRANLSLLMSWCRRKHPKRTTFLLRAGAHHAYWA